MSAPHEDDDRTPVPPDGDGWTPTSLDGDPGLDDSAVDALGALLRERMQQAVAGLEPQGAALEMLRRAVPARRRRRHAALATTAVTVFAVGAGAMLAARGSLLDPPEPRHAGGTEVGNLMSTGTSGAPGGGSGHGPDPISGQQNTASASPSSATGTSATSLSQTTKGPPPSVSSAGPASGAPALSPCQSSSVSSVVGTQTSVGGIVYETVVGTVKSACTLTGTPALSVSGGTGSGGTGATGGTGALGRVTQYKPDPAVTPLLAGLPSGQTLILAPGDRFEFRFAWVPLACAVQPSPTIVPTTVATTGSPASPTVVPTTPGSSGGAVATPTGPTPTRPTPAWTTATSTAPAGSSYSVSYAVSGTQSQQTAIFSAACGAALYVTDYFPPDGKSTRHGTEGSATATTALSAAH
ncbi:hypothetical protein GCM10009839_28010 [Catenulispora yoronensis]|uniref:DUF4232 domain-containing protein n=1 Tax=Catenulispora yoronensis TaxID=450799 RepID=A0ABN2U2S9_9ACTN